VTAQWLVLVFSFFYFLLLRNTFRKLVPIALTTNTSHQSPAYRSAFTYFAHNPRVGTRGYSNLSPSGIGRITQSLVLCKLPAAELTVMFSIIETFTMCGLDGKVAKDQGFAPFPTKLRSLR